MDSGEKEKEIKTDNCFRLLAFIRDTSTSRKTQWFLFHRENGPDAEISTRVKIFRFFICPRGYVWPMETLDSDYLVPAQ